MSLFDILENSSRKYPDKVAMRFAGASFTYAELSRRVDRLASALRGLGIKAQDKVALMCPNGNAYVEIVFACAKIGAVTEHFSMRWSKDETRRLIDRSDAKLAFASAGSSLFELIEKGGGPRLIEVGTSPYEGAYERLLPTGDPGCEAADVDPRDAAIQLYTSGTSGRPKGVLLGSGAVVLQTMVTATEGRWAHDDVLLCTLPLYHMTCLSLFQIIYVGGQVVLGETTQAEEMARLIEECGITRATLVPSLLDKLASYAEAHTFDLGSLRTIVYGSARMSPALMTRCRRHLRCSFYQAYGMTEMTGTVAMLSPEHHLDPSIADSVGTSVFGIRIRIVDETGSECPVGEQGEIVVSGATMMLGYLDDPDREGRVIEDGWYRTNDLGSLDEKGFLHLAGRKDDMINSGGENIFPDEIAECIRTIGAEIVEAVVLGVEDDLWGETPAAFVVKQASSSLDEDAVVRHCAQRLARYKKPKYVHFLDELPRTAGGKIVKRALLDIHHKEQGVKHES